MTARSRDILHIVCTAMTERGEMTTRELCSVLSWKHCGSLSYQLSLWSEAGYVEHGTPRARPDAACAIGGPKTVCTWRVRSAPKPRQDRASIAMQRVLMCKATNGDSIVASALAARPDVQCAMAGWLG